MASGMPWPRMRSEPYRAMRPMMSAPATGTSYFPQPRWLPAGETSAVLHRLKEEEVCENADQPEQRQRDEGADEADADGEPGNPQRRDVMVKSPSFSAPPASAGCITLDSFDNALWN